ncbi:MAG: 4-hydroxythreonine-4-phosphate dehydrogenase PdxA [Nitrospinota bacterium]|nr:MAG: 4-hydroxythreonine-4-phosphate dehydrogenase PdxA [Nitrospinota bacterium]
MPTQRPDVAWVLGDPAGIGAEIVAQSLVNPELRAMCRPVIVGPGWLLERGLRIAQVTQQITPCRPEQLAQLPADAIPLIDAGWPYQEIPLGKVSKAAGCLAMQMLQTGITLAQKGLVAAVVYAPLNKEALKQAGNPYGDELRLIASWLQESEVGEVNVMDQLFTTRVTSHVPLREVAALLHPERVLQAIRLLHQVLLQARITPPRIGVAALNPHGGEHGLFGNEESEIIAPAIERARELGIDAQGPFPADTIFVRARRGDFQGVVTMYHDQGQIAIKLLGFEQGVTVSGGLSIPVTTPAHGTAFDIVGKGIAHPGAFQAAARLAARMAGSTA